jgi:hypothetical protein
MIMQYIKQTIFILITFVLTACGGGGGGDSSSGGGSDSTYAGTYTGTETWSISSPDVPSIPPETGTTTLTVVIASNGNVTITDSEGIQFTGSITGQNLSATGTIGEITVPGANCPASTITYTGTVSGSSISGSLSGVYNCTLTAGDGFAVTIGGTFTVTLQSAGASALSDEETKRLTLQGYISSVVGR